MVVVLDTVGHPAPAPSRRRRTGRIRRSLRKPDWIRVRRRARRSIARPTTIVARARPGHGVRGGRLPQYRRVLVEEARHLHDHGRHLHARLRLLQRAHRPAGAARPPTSRRRSPTPSPSSASTTSSSPRSTATTSPTAAPSISPRTIRAIRAREQRHDDRGADPGLPAQGRRAGDGGRGAARRLQPQSRDGAVELSDGAARRALFPLAAPAAAGEGTRPDDVHQVRHHGRPRRGAERGAPADGRSAARRRRLPDHRPVPAADPQAPSGRCAS